MANRLRVLIFTYICAAILSTCTTTSNSVENTTSPKKTQHGELLNQESFPDENTFDEYWEDDWQFQVRNTHKPSSPISYSTPKKDCPLLYNTYARLSLDDPSSKKSPVSVNMQSVFELKGDGGQRIEVVLQHLQSGFHPVRRLSSKVHLALDQWSLKKTLLKNRGRHLLPMGQPGPYWNGMSIVPGLSLFFPKLPEATAAGHEVTQIVPVAVNSPILEYSPSMRTPVGHSISVAPRPGQWKTFGKWRFSPQLSSPLSHAEQLNVSVKTVKQGSIGNSQATLLKTSLMLPVLVKAHKPISVRVALSGRILVLSSGRLLRALWLGKTPSLELGPLKNHVMSMQYEARLVQACNGPVAPGLVHDMHSPYSRASLIHSLFKTNIIRNDYNAAARLFSPEVVQAHGVNKLAALLRKHVSQFGVHAFGYMQAIRKYSHVDDFLIRFRTNGDHTGPLFQKVSGNVHLWFDIDLRGPTLSIDRLIAMTPHVNGQLFLVICPKQLFSAAGSPRRNQTAEFKRLLGPPSISKLVDHVMRADKQSIVMHFEALASRGEEAQSGVDVFFWRRFLNHKEPSVRAAAVSALVKIGDHHVLRFLLSSINDRHPSVRKNAAWGLGRHVRLIWSTEKLPKNASLGFRMSKNDIDYYRGQILVALTKTLGDKNEEVRAAAIWALGQMGDLAFKTSRVLKKALKDKSLVVRRASVCALGKIMGADPGHAIKVLSIALRDKAPSVVQEARRTLEIIQGKGLAHLIADLKSNDRDKRQWATMEIVKGGKREVSALVNLLSSQSPTLRKESINVIAQMGARADSAIDALYKLARKPELLGSTNAIAALGQLGERAFPVLFSLVHGPEEIMLMEDAFEAGGEKALAWLIKKYETGNVVERRVAIRALIKFDDRARTVLEQSQKDSDRQVRNTGKEGLELINLFK